MSEDWPESLVKIARARIAAGTVSRTRYGIRVECRPEFNDNRVEAEAYWPDRGCRCWQANAEKICSHAIAARLFESEWNPYDFT